MDDESSGSESSSYFDDYRGFRNGRGRESMPRSIRTSHKNLKNASQRSLDVDNESDRYSRRGRTNSIGNRRDSTQSKSRQRLRSLNAEDSGNDSATRALVQAKIREKVAQQSSFDESSSDLFKPKTGKETKTKAEVLKKSKAITSKSPSIEKLTPKETKASEVRAKTKTEKPLTTKKSDENERKATLATPESDHEIDETAALPDGPPPTAPDYEWECEFCTFTNAPNTKICAICCKTPTKNAIRKTSNVTESPTKERVRKSSVAKKSTTTTSDTKGMKITRKISFWPGTK